MWKLLKFNVKIMIIFLFLSVTCEHCLTMNQKTITYCHAKKLVYHSNTVTFCKYVWIPFLSCPTNIFSEHLQKLIRIVLMEIEHFLIAFFWFTDNQCQGPKLVASQTHRSKWNDRFDTVTRVGRETESLCATWSRFRAHHQHLWNKSIY